MWWHTHRNQISFFQRNERIRLNRRGLQSSRLLAAEVCASAVVMMHTSCSEVVWSVLATNFIRQFPLHFPSRASPCAITFQLDSTWNVIGQTASVSCCSYLHMEEGFFTDVGWSKKERIPFIFNDESTGSCICLRLDLYMSYLQGCAFNTRL
jgi:hypothetical protein